MCLLSLVLDHGEVFITAGAPTCWSRVRRWWAGWEVALGWMFKSPRPRSLRRRRGQPMASSWATLSITNSPNSSFITWARSRSLELGLVGGVGMGSVGGATAAAGAGISLYNTGGGRSSGNLGLGGRAGALAPARPTLQRVRPPSLATACSSASVSSPWYLRQLSMHWLVTAMGMQICSPEVPKPR